MKSLIRRCAQSKLHFPEIRQLLGAVDFARDILPRIHGPRHDARRLRELLCNLNAQNSIGSQTMENHSKSREVFHYLREPSHPHHGRGNNPEKDRISPDYPRSSLFRLAEYAKSQPPSIGVIDFLDSEKCTIVGFCLPPFTCLPLHDHPAMTVLMKIVFGDVWLTSFDPLQSNEKAIFPSTANPPLAHLVNNSVVTSQNEVSAITPPGKGGYYHHMAAGKNGGVFVDVIFPPYGTPPAFSQCTYYTVQSDPCSNENPGKDRTYPLSPAPDPCIPMHMLPFGDPVED
ncbi:hypothetical protein XU18_3942 [Perkinsela sp. CCAP 1560/4]|nr:hypothetical protein XU18_3942 [Perkinsela sp. CCAP 1560/4]|eukprot:KNH04958.1 hypothetical protein XU18_3942 [Perkinsela sp. CCAP 1560/4]